MDEPINLDSAANLETTPTMSQRVNFNPGLMDRRVLMLAYLGAAMPDVLQTATGRNNAKYQNSFKLLQQKGLVQPSVDASTPSITDQGKQILTSRKLIPTDGQSPSVTETGLKLYKDMVAEDPALDGAGDPPQSDGGMGDMGGMDDTGMGDAGMDMGMDGGDMGMGDTGKLPMEQYSVIKKLNLSLHEQKLLGITSERQK